MTGGAGVSSTAFHSIHTHGFVRVAACTPKVAVGDPGFNAAQTLAMAREGAGQGVDLMLFPELGLSAYAIDDLFLQDVLLRRVEDEIAGLAAASVELAPVLVVGAPVRHGGALYNCAVVISRAANVLVHGSKIVRRGAGEADSHRKGAGTAEFGE